MEIPRYQKQLLRELLDVLFWGLQDTNNAKLSYLETHVFPRKIVWDKHFKKLQDVAAKAKEDLEHHFAHVVMDLKDDTTGAGGWDKSLQTWLNANPNAQPDSTPNTEQKQTPEHKQYT